MKKIIICFLLFLTCVVSLAQTVFSTNLLNGDVKMKEHFYEMALSYYQNAIQEANSAEEIAIAEKRILDCKQAISLEKEEKAIASTQFRLLFSDQYLETGVIYDDTDSAVESSFDINDYPLSIYQIEVYRDVLVITSHVDANSSPIVGFLPAGTKLPLVEETDIFRRFSSGREGENFIVLKSAQKNSYGWYRNIYREQEKQFYVLYPMALIKEINLLAETKKSASKKEESSVSEESHPDTVQVYPIHFTDNWLLNINEVGERIGDSRIAPLSAREVCWLMFRFRYSCPTSFNESIHFDFKLIDPSGNLVVFPGKGTKTGYSASEELETIPGGGIFNIVVGSNKPGSFRKGRYTLSLWCDKVEYYSVVIELE